jgi:peroxiredoxin
VRTVLYHLALVASLAAALVLGCTPSSSGSSSAPARPPAEDFVLPDLEGRSVRLSDFEGQVRLVNFWATWCGPYWLEVPHLQALHERYRDEGLAVIGISLDRDGMQQAVSDFASKMELTYPVSMGDETTRRAYGGVNGIPTTFLIDREGSIPRVFQGYRDRAVFEDAVRPLLAEDGGESLAEGGT